MEKEGAGQKYWRVRGIKLSWEMAGNFFDRILAGYYNFLKVSYWRPDE
jgi:hypothetical protein